MTDIFDYLGRKYQIIAETEIPELKGDGGYMSFARTEVTININDTYTLEFALHVKPPALLYINGKPCTKNVLYLPTLFGDGYTYGVYFPEIVYNLKNNAKKEIIMIRTMNAKVAKCLAVL